MADLNSRIDAFHQELQSLGQEALKDDEARKKLFGVVVQGMTTLEAPIETIWRMIMTVCCTSVTERNHRTQSRLTFTADSLINLLLSWL